MKKLIFAGMLIGNIAFGANEIKLEEFCRQQAEIIAYSKYWTAPEPRSLLQQMVFTKYDCKSIYLDEPNALQRCREILIREFNELCLGSAGEIPGRQETRR